MPRERLIPDDDNVVRFCRGLTVFDGKPTPSSFRLRRKGQGISRDEKHLSVNWLEHFKETDVTTVFRAIKRVIKDRSTPLEEGRFVILNTGAAKRLVRKNTGIDIRFVHHPSRSGHNESHSLVKGFNRSADLSVATQLHQLIKSGQIYPVPD